MKLPLVRFQGNVYCLVGNLQDGGALATPEQYATGQTSYAHVFPGKGVMRFREKIGEVEDVQLTGEIVDVGAEVDAMIRVLVESRLK